MSSVKRKRGEEKGNNQADVARRGLVSLNKLDYNMDVDLSVCVSRSSKKHFFQQTAYEPLQNAICISNSGAEYVCPQNCYLSFIATHTVTTIGDAFHFGMGSAVNFIKRIILTTRSGDEIERVEEVNRLAPILDRYLNSKSWLETVGSLAGYSNNNTSFNSEEAHHGQEHGCVLDGTGKSQWLLNKGDGFPAGVQKEVSKLFVIPLSCISGLFKSFDRLLPAHLMSGLRFEIHWESAASALHLAHGTTDTANLKFTNVELTFDQYQLTDSIMRVLNEEATLRGLEIPFTTFYNHRTSGNGNKAFVEVRKAVSRALGIITKVGPLSEADKFIDQTKSDIMTLMSYQVRVGSLYFPQQPIKGNQNYQHSQKEFYHHTLRGLGKLMSPSAPGSVRYVDFEGINNGDFTGGANGREFIISDSKCGGLGMMYTDLERSNVQKLTGIPINNSRVAEVMMESWERATVGANQTDGAIQMFDNTSRQIDVWLHYVRLLRVFLQNVEIEE